MNANIVAADSIPRRASKWKTVINMIRVLQAGNALEIDAGENPKSDARAIRAHAKALGFSVTIRWRVRKIYITKRK